MTTGASVASVAGVAAAAQATRSATSLTSAAVSSAPGQRGLRLPSVVRGGDDAQGATPDPRAAPFVAAVGPPSAAAGEGAGRTASIPYRSGAADHQQPGAVAEGVIQRDHRIGVHDDVLGHLARDERLPERIALEIAPHASDTDAQHLGDHVGHLAGCERLANQRGDDLARCLGLAGTHRTRSPFDGRQLLSGFVGDHRASARAAAVDPYHDVAHDAPPMVEGRGDDAGTGCVNDESMPVRKVMEVPMRTYHGQAT